MRRPAARSGVILLHAVWLLLTLSLLAGLLLQAARRGSTEIATAVAQARREALQEAAIELVVHDLATRGSRSRWAQPPMASGTVSVEGAELAVNVQRVDGLVDLLRAEDSVLAPLLAKVLGDGHHAFATRLAPLRERATAASYAQVQAAGGISDAAIDCLYRFATLFSGRALPDAALAAGLVRSLLPPQAAPQPSAIEAPATIGPPTWRIDMSRPGEAGARTGLSVEVTVTGLLEPAYMVKSRQITSANHTDCPVRQ